MDEHASPPTCPRRLAELRRTLAEWSWSGPVPTAEMVVEETNRRVTTEHDPAVEPEEHRALSVTIEDYRALLAGE